MSSLENGWRYVDRKDDLQGPLSLGTLRCLLNDSAIDKETPVHHRLMGWRWLGHVLLGAEYVHPQGPRRRASGPPVELSRAGSAKQDAASASGGGGAAAAAAAAAVQKALPQPHPVRAATGGPPPREPNRQPQDARAAQINLPRAAVPGAAGGPGRGPAFGAAGHGFLDATQELWGAGEREFLVEDDDEDEDEVGMGAQGRRILGAAGPAPHKGSPAVLDGDLFSDSDGDDGMAADRPGPSAGPAAKRQRQEEVAAVIARAAGPKGQKVAARQPMPQPAAQAAQRQEERAPQLPGAPMRPPNGLPPRPDSEAGGAGRKEPEPKSKPKSHPASKDGPARSAAPPRQGGPRVTVAAAKVGAAPQPPRPPPPAAAVGAGGGPDGSEDDSDEAVVHVRKKRKVAAGPAAAGAGASAAGRSAAARGISAGQGGAGTTGAAAGRGGPRSTQPVSGPSNKTDPAAAGNGTKPSTAGASGGVNQTVAPGGTGPRAGPVQGGAAGSAASGRGKPPRPPPLVVPAEGADGTGAAGTSARTTPATASTIGPAGDIEARRMSATQPPTVRAQGHSPSPPAPEGGAVDDAGGEDQATEAPEQAAGGGAVGGDAAAAAGGPAAQGLASSVTAAAARLARQAIPLPKIAFQRPKSSFLSSLTGGAPPGGAGSAAFAAPLKPPLMDTWENLPAKRRENLYNTLAQVLEPVYEYKQGTMHVAEVCILQLKDSLDRGQLARNVTVSDMETGSATHVERLLQEHSYQIAFMESVRDNKPPPMAPKVVDVSQHDQLPSPHAIDQYNASLSRRKAGAGAGARPGGGPSAGGAEANTGGPATEPAGDGARRGAFFGQAGLPPPPAAPAAAGGPPPLPLQRVDSADAGMGRRGSTRLSDSGIGPAGAKTPLPPYRVANTGYAPLSQAQHRRRGQQGQAPPAPSAPPAAARPSVSPGARSGWPDAGGSSAGAAWDDGYGDDGYDAGGYNAGGRSPSPEPLEPPSLQPPVRVSNSGTDRPGAAVGGALLSAPIPKVLDAGLPSPRRPNAGGPPGAPGAPSSQPPSSQPGPHQPPQPGPMPSHGGQPPAPPPAQAQQPRPKPPGGTAAPAEALPSSSSGSLQQRPFDGSPPERPPRSGQPQQPQQQAPLQERRPAIEPKPGPESARDVASSQENLPVSGSALAAPPQVQIPKAGAAPTPQATIAHQPAQAAPPQTQLPKADAAPTQQAASAHQPTQTAFPPGLGPPGLGPPGLGPPGLGPPGLASPGLGPQQGPAAQGPAAQGPAVQGAVLQGPATQGRAAASGLPPGLAPAPHTLPDRPSFPGATISQPAEQGQPSLQSQKAGQYQQQQFPALPPHLRRADPQRGQEGAKARQEQQQGQQPQPRQQQQEMQGRAPLQGSAQVMPGGGKGQGPPGHCSDAGVAAAEAAGSRNVTAAEAPANKAQAGGGSAGTGAVMALLPPAAAARPSGLAAQPANAATPAGPSAGPGTQPVATPPAGTDARPAAAVAAAAETPRPAALAVMQVDSNTVQLTFNMQNTDQVLQQLQAWMNAVKAGEQAPEGAPKPGPTPAGAPGGTSAQHSPPLGPQLQPQAGQPLGHDAAVAAAGVPPPAQRPEAPDPQQPGPLQPPLRHSISAVVESVDRAPSFQAAPSLRSLSAERHPQSQTTPQATATAAAPEAAEVTQTARVAPLPVVKPEPGLEEAPTGPCTLGPKPAPAEVDQRAPSQVHGTAAAGGPTVKQELNDGATPAGVRHRGAALPGPTVVSFRIWPLDMFLCDPHIPLPADDDLGLRPLPRFTGRRDEEAVVVSDDEDVLVSDGEDDDDVEVVLGGGGAGGAVLGTAPGVEARADGEGAKGGSGVAAPGTAAVNNAAIQMLFNLLRGGG